MAYEIPQELEYQEKIIFGLTLKQVFYALVFSPFLLVILFKLELGMTLRIALALIPSTLACVFMFTELPKKFFNWWKWLSFRQFLLMDFKMKRFFNLDKVEDNVLFLKDRKLSIIKVEPVNFSIKNSKEQEIVISSFQKFLNSLDFPVQIVIATDSLNLDYYLNLLEERVEKTKNCSYASLFNDYKEFLQGMISTKGLLNRSFYLVIPEKPDIGLKIQVGVCEELLNNMDLKFKRLIGEEIMNCLSSFFNDLYNDDKKEIDEIPEKDYLHYNVAPKEIINYANEIKIGDKIARTISVKGYPRVVEEGFLDKIITLNGDFDLAIHIEPYPIETMMLTLNRELQKQRSDLWAMQQKGIINPSLEIKYKDTRNVLEQLQKGSEKLFNISLYITCKGNTLDELDLLTKKVESELNSLMMIPHKTIHEMHKGIKSTIPLGINELNIKRNVTTKPISAFFPFTSQFLQVDESGVWLGLNKNNIPIIKDIFRLHNANGVVLASSGGGKSYFTKLMISRLLLNGTKVMVVDPQAEYVDLAEKFNGQVITISKTSDTIINPLDLMGHDYDEKKLTLLDLFPVMIGATSEIQKAVLDRALTTVYEAKGITNDKKTWKREPPIMQDLLNQLVAMSKNATQIEKETYRSLINRIQMYVTGVFSFLNRQTNLNFENRFVCFNIGDMPNQVKPAIMFLVLDYVYMKMKKDIERKILVIDEAWSLLERTEDESYIFKIVKTCRKFNLGLLLITQDVADLLKNDAGKALLNNSEYTLLLRQKPSIIDQVEKTFKLSNKEREKLLTATSGEGILIISNEHSEIKIIASPEEHDVITTNADEKLQREIENANEVVVEFEKATLDYSKGWFKKSQLSKEEVEELLNKGYILSSLVGIYGGQREAYLLKPRHNESPEHFFITKMIEEYLRRYTDKVELFETKEPDIVFEANEKKVAVEVETGLKLRKNNPRIEEKVILLNKKFNDDWFFVVVDWKDKEKYLKYGNTYVRKEVPAILKKQYFSQGSNSTGREAENLENKHFEVQTLPGIRAENFEPLNQEGSATSIAPPKTTKEAKENGTRTKRNKRAKQANTGNPHKQKQRRKVHNTQDSNHRHQTNKVL